MPSPALMGITPTTQPEVLQVLDNTGAWVELGTVDPTSHTFTGAGGFSAVFDNLAAIQAATIPAAVNNIVSLSYANPGDLLGNQMMFARSASGSAGMPYVQSADGAWWLLSNNVVMPEMFGAKRDGVTDDAGAIQATINYMEALTVPGGIKISPIACQFSPGVYYCTVGLVSTKAARYFVAVASTSADQGQISTTIQFPGNFAGLFGWHFIHANGGTCTVENIFLLYGNTRPNAATAAPIHGWGIDLTIRMIGCAAQLWPGNGFHINGGFGFSSTFTGTITGTNLTFPSVTTGAPGVGQTVTGAGVTATKIIAGSGLSWTVDISQNVGPVAMTATTPNGLVDSAIFRACLASENGYNGFYGYGANFNINLFDTCYAFSNLQYGFRDNGVLGNVYLNTQTSGNGIYNITSPYISPAVNYNGATYVVTPVSNLNNNDFALTLPSTTTPGTNSAVWTLVSNSVISGSQPWAPGTLYQPGGPYYMNNHNLLIHPYSEAGQVPSWVTGNVLDILDLGAVVPYISSAMNFLDGGLQISQPNVALDPLGVYPYENINIYFGNAGATRTNGTSQFWAVTGSVSGGFGMYFDYSTYALYCGLGSPFGTAGWAITGGGPTPATFTGTIAGTNLTMPSVTTGTVAIGKTVTGAGVTATKIIAGSGLSWTVDKSQNVGPVAMTASTGNLNAPTFGLPTSLAAAGTLAVSKIAVGYVRTQPTWGLCLSAAQSQPGGGAYGVGWFTHANNPNGNGLLGWQCIAAGSPGTQQALYGVIGPSTIANLPAASVGAGARAFVTNSSQVASGNFGATLSATTGANKVPVYSDGVNWIIG